MECESRKPRRKNEAITFHEPTMMMVKFIFTAPGIPAKTQQKLKKARVFAEFFGFRRFSGDVALKD